MARPLLAYRPSPPQGGRRPAVSVPPKLRLCGAVGLSPSPLWGGVGEGPLKPCAIALPLRGGPNAISDESDVCLRQRLLEQRQQPLPVSRRTCFVIDAVATRHRPAMRHPDIVLHDVVDFGD